MNMIDDVPFSTVGYGWWTKSCTIIYERFYTSQVVVWDFFHQQYVSFLEGIIFKFVVSTHLKNMLVKLDHFPR